MIRRTLIALMLAGGLIAGSASVGATAPAYYEPGSSCSIHWVSNGLRVKLVNTSSRGAYITCYYDLWDRGQWPHDHWKTTSWVGAHRYKFRVNYRAIRYDWAKVTGSAIR